MFSWGASTKHELQHVITITDTLRLLTPLIFTLSQVPLRPKDSAGGRPDSDCRIWHAANEKRTLWPLSCIFAWEQPLIFDIPWSTSACSFLKSAVTFPEHTLRETHTDCFSIWEKSRECTFAHGASTLAFSCLPSPAILTKAFASMNLEVKCRNCAFVKLGGCYMVLWKVQWSSGQRPCASNYSPDLHSAVCTKFSPWSCCP